MDSTHATRAHRSMQQQCRDIDDLPIPATMLSDELRAAAMIDYCEDCRSDPEGDWPPFDEYVLEWLEARLYDQHIAMYEEMEAEELAAMRALEASRGGPFPVCGDDEIPW